MILSKRFLTAQYSYLGVRFHTCVVEIHVNISRFTYQRDGDPVFDVHPELTAIRTTMCTFVCPNNLIYAFQISSQSTSSIKRHLQSTLSNKHRVSTARRDT